MHMLPRSVLAFPALLVLVPLAAPQGLRPGRLPNVLDVPAEFATIQAAVDAARDGDVVRVAPGSYAGFDFRGKAIEVVAPQGAERTHLVGDFEGPVVRCTSGEGPDSRLMGFTIRNGLSSTDGVGGGIACSDGSGGVSDPYVSDCTIENCFADFLTSAAEGAAVGGNPILERCVLRQNSAQFDGAGVYGAPTMLQCLVEDNLACEGGGLYLLSGARIEDTLLRRNSAGSCVYHGVVQESSGGGITAFGNDILLQGCVLVGNWVDEFPDFGDPTACGGFIRGGALNAVNASGLTLRRCTLFGNRVEQCALVGGIEGSPSVIDCIVSGNEDAPGLYAAQPFAWSIVQGGAAGPGVIDADPQFVDASALDLRLRPNSPAVDAGDPASPLDPDGTRADLGAHHRPRARAAITVAWHERAALATDDSVTDFGQSLALSGDTLLVGAAASDPAAGAAVVLRRVAGVWSEEARLSAGQGQVDDGFGYAVALDGDVAAVSAPFGNHGGSPGAVHVFERTSANAPFVETLTLLPSTANDGFFGTALALDHGTLVVGTGANAYVFRRRTRMLWTEVAELRPPGFNPTGFSMEFGDAVALEGDTIVVGAAAFEAGEQAPGRVFVYERPGATIYSWVLSSVLAPSDTAGLGNFGASVSLSEDSLLVGSNFGVYAYERRGPGLSWSRADKLSSTPSRALVVGARAFVVQVFDAGARVREFDQSSPGAPWTRVARFDAAGRPPLSRAMAFAQSELFLGGADGAVRVLGRGAVLDTLERDQAADEELVRLTGTELDSVSAVLVDGVAQPIVAQSAGEIALRPARRAPGFADLTLVTAAGDTTLSDGFHSLPTLDGRSSGPGGALSVELENGEAGAYLLMLGFDLRARPFVLTTPPTYHAFFLRSTPGRFAILGADAFTNAGVAEATFALPNDPALTGLTAHLQAWCRRGLFGAPRYSFTNVADVEL